MEINAKFVIELRTKLGLTQEEFANKLSVHKRTVQNWEGGSKIPSVKHTILRDLWNQAQEGETEETEWENIRKKKLFISEPKGIIAVPIKAQANYSKHFNDVVFQNQLERIYIPNSPYDGDNFRYFQIEGDSMEYLDEQTGRPAGLEHGAWIIGEKVPPEDWSHNLRKYYVYIIVTDSRITIKRVLQDNHKEIVLHADNELYGQERISLDKIKEIWIFRRKLDWNAPPPRKIEITV